MASNDILFSIDAGKILATLHLAAITQAPNYKPICNTGVKDCNDGDTPEKPGKSSFDFQNKSGTYQIGFFKENIYPELINLKGNELLKKELEALDKLLNAQKLTDTDDKVKAQKEKIVKLKLQLTGAKEKEFDKIDEEINKINEERAKRKEEVLNKLKKDAFKDIKQYLTTFSGKEHASKLKEDEIVVSMLDKPPKKVNDIIVKNYQILDSITDKKIANEILKKISDIVNKAKSISDLDKVTMTFCYKIGYSVNINAK